MKVTFPQLTGYRYDITTNNSILILAMFADMHILRITQPLSLSLP
nr:hypothetical protein [Nostoc sp. ChiSLP03a]